ncbi:hypothetical protein BU15DRAFT_57559 [Melanogaster broomeanus]|nr:hypothetical protein BU15DRAFT_57695 [Melanogaster broomeanus]KAF9230133.1 hypothetical protein BU15DRAFT_57559 [Melanogaster broomeanus]
MRLTFSTSNYRNADLSDEWGHVLYNIHTPSRFGKTTIKKCHGGVFDGSSVVAVIDWHTFRSDKIHFGEQVVKADELLKRRWLSSDRHCVGPDGRAYKWKLRSSSRNCLQAENSPVELAKYHKRNFGIMTPSHPPHLEISPSVTHMLDYIITTFVYVENLSEQQHKSDQGAAV